MTDNKIQKFYLHGILRTLSPLHIAAPGDSHFDMSDGRVKYGSHNGKGGFPATSIQKLPYAVPGDKGWQFVPVIPANNIMGHLRRCAAAIVCEHFIEAGEMISPSLFNVLNCGAATGKPDVETLTFETYQMNKDHLYMGLLGGGPNLMRRYVTCNNLVPKTEATASALETIIHPLGFEAITHQADKLIFSWFGVHIDDLEKLAHPELAYQVVEDFAQQYADRNEKIRGQRDRKKEQAASGDRGPAKEKDSTRATFGLEFVIPQVEFPVVWELKVNRAQLGFFLMMLARFVRTDRIGGWSRNGFGQFALNELTLSGDLVDDAGLRIDPIGDLIQNRALNDSHPFIAETVQHFRAALAEMTAAETEALVFPKLAA